jgi:putative serine protease PepD
MGNNSSVSLAASTAVGVDWASVDDAISPSVVAVDVSAPSGTISGSGLLFIAGGKDAYVITDYSLVAGGGAVLVTFPSGEQANAVVYGEDSLSSLALLAVPGMRSNFPTLGSVADLQVASPVMAVAARTSSGGSVFPGSVTAQDREVDLAGGSEMQDLIAISSTTVPPAATGGPLVDQQGRVVGIIVDLQPTDTADQGLSFAVPVDVAEQVAQQILSGGPINHPWLGVTNAVDISTAVARQLGLQGGAQVGDVSPNSPASRIGLQSRDIITALNGLPVISSGALVQQVVGHCRYGSVATISYLHQGKPAQATFYVTNQPTGS